MDVGHAILLAGIGVVFALYRMCYYDLELVSGWLKSTIHELEAERAKRIAVEAELQAVRSAKERWEVVFSPPVLPMVDLPADIER